MASKPCLDCGGDKGSGAGRKYCPTCSLKHRENRRYRYRGVRGQSLRPRHGLTVEEYDAMAAAQGGVCAICGIDPPKGTQGSKLLKFSVDHDHDTGEIRGLLCNRCNVGLHFLEQTEWRHAAERYMAEPPYRGRQPLTPPSPTPTDYVRPKGCICPMFRDTGRFRIADLCCVVHGVNGTDPGDGYWELAGDCQPLLSRAES